MQTKPDPAHNKKHSYPPNGQKKQSLFYAFLTFLIIIFVGGLVALYQISSSLGLNESPSPTQFLVTAIFSLLVLGTIIAQIVVSLFQWQAAREQGEMFAKQIDLMIRNECAYIGIDDWTVENPIDNKLVVSGIFFNGGRTPAWKFRRQFQVGTGIGTPPPDFGIDPWLRRTIDAPDSMIIAGGDTKFSTDPLQLKPETWDELHSGEQVIVVDGECIYEDTTGREWIYSFGFTIDISETNPIALERYQRHTEYNPDETEEGQNPN